MAIAADIRAVAQNLIAWLVSLGVTALAIVVWPGFVGGETHLVSFTYTVPQAAAALLLFATVGIVIAHCLNRALSRARTFSGRENAQAHNVSLVRRCCIEREADDFLSTRVTYWDLAENSVSRLAFRSMITEKIAAGFLVKRIWHLSSLDDITRLRRYLTDYSNYDNYHVRVLTDLKYPIPELICVGKKCASITFPEIRSPRRMSLTVQFRRPPEIEAVRKYYELLWDLAIPIKAGSEIYRARLDDVEARMSLISIPTKARRY